MSISSAMHNAYSGISAASRSAETVSNNLANALTEGFARRELVLSSLTLSGYGQGVQVTGIERAADRVATAARRDAGAVSGVAHRHLAAAERMAMAFGDPALGGAVSDKLTAFEAALTAATNDPSSAIALDTAVLRAGEVTAHLNDASEALAGIRADADADIAGQVDTLNSALEALKDLNVEIRKRVNGAGDISALVDRREQLIDTVSEIMPVLVVDRPFEQVSLFTPEGGVLIDETNVVSQFSFTATPFIDHSMTLGAPLSGLVLNGNTVPIGGGTGFYDGGTLGAMFDVRDTEVPELNAKLDGLARDLVERFQDPAVDSTLLATDAGLFTDGGAAFAVANEVGLAGRIAINPIADPDQGGASWHLRDGLNAAAAGFAGDNTILKNMEAAMSAQRAPGAGLGMTVSLSASGFFGAVTAEASQTMGRRDADAEFAETEFAVMREMESSRTGVDSDEQLQRMMEVERLYAANARVVQVLDEMLDALMRIGR